MISLKRFMSLVDWLSAFTKEHNGLKSILAKSFQSKIADETCLMKLLVVFDSLPLELKLKLQNFIFDMLMDPYFKINFSVAFTTLYQRNMAYYVHFPIKHSVVLHNFSVQIYSSPISTPKLVTENFLLNQLFFNF